MPSSLFGTRARSRAGAAPAPLPWDEVLTSFTDAVIVTDQEGRVVLFNHAAEELCGIPQARVVGQSCAETFRNVPLLAEMIERVRNTGSSESHGDEELRFGRRCVPVRIVSVPIWGARDVLRGVAVVISDLSHQKRLEESARRNENLARLGTLVAGLAHEIRNPLAGMKGAAQLLAQRVGHDPALREYTDLISREATRLSSLVEDLLALGTPPRPRLESLNIHRVIQRALDLVVPELDRRGFEIQCEFDPSLPEVDGDESQLCQVFLNLLKNAMDAMSEASSPAPPRNHILVRTRMETDFHILRQSDAARKYLRVEIADQGTGIDPRHAMRIFEPFFTTKARGTGLGLAISHRIVAEHGGVIRAEANQPTGTILTVSLPVARR